MENDYTAAKGAASYTDNDIKAVKHGGNRISGLDGLRTLAITGVTLFHMFPQTIRGGWLGVSLFLCLPVSYWPTPEKREGKSALFPSFPMAGNESKGYIPPLSS